MLLIIYWILGYWAVGRTIYKNKVLFGTVSAIFLQKAILGFIMGWILIPIAALGWVFGRK